MSDTTTAVPEHVPCDICGKPCSNEPVEGGDIRASECDVVLCDTHSAEDLVECMRKKLGFNPTTGEIKKADPP